MSYQREFKTRIPIAVIGTGSHSYRNILPVLNYLPVRLVAICDLNIEMGQATAAQYGCTYYQHTDELYRNEPDITAVFICVGPKYHPALVCEALHAERHVWVEKPLAVRASQVEEMIQLRKNQIVVVGLKKAFMPATTKAKEIISSSNYGGLKSILATYHMTLPSNGEQILTNEETPNWLLNGVHPLAFLSETGGAVEEVLAYTNPTGQGAVLLQFKNGVMGTLHLSSGPQPDVERYDLFADHWEMSIHNQQVELRRSIPFTYGQTTDFVAEGDEGGTIVWQATNCVATLENKALFTQGFYAECKHFCDCILENQQPQTGSLEQAMEIMRVYEAALISNGKPIRL